MFRFLARLIGFLLVAAGFVGLVVDGTRSIANATLMFLPLGDVIAAMFPKVYPLIEPAVTRQIHPVLWNPILLNLFAMPASLLAFGLGVVLLWVGRKPPEPIGYLARR
jgi:hypothetical protein